MILLRCRRFGESEWTEISVNGPAERVSLSCVGAGLSSSPMHVQQMDDEGEWVDLSEMNYDDGLEVE